MGEENTMTAAEVFLAVKALKAAKAAGCDEIRPALTLVLPSFYYFTTSQGVENDSKGFIAS